MRRRFDDVERRVRALLGRRAAIAGGIVVLAGAVVAVATTLHSSTPSSPPEIEVSSQARRFYRPTAAEWARLVVERAEQVTFRSERITEGKIAIDEDHATPIFSPYSGRVTKLLAKPGDDIQRGQPLFVIEATEIVQGLNDFMAAATGLNKARAALTLAGTIEQRAHELYLARAVPLKDWQEAQAELLAARNDQQAADTTLEAARNRLRILGQSDDQIAAFQQGGAIVAETPIPSPIAGTIIQRKVGPGQYVTSGASEPVFVVGDLSTVWLTAFVRETEVPSVAVGQQVTFTVPATGKRMFTGTINYVSDALDPMIRRLQVRATVDNRDGQLKPEMMADVSIVTGAETPCIAIPRYSLVQEGSQVRVWVARDDNAIELRQIKTGLVNGNMIQVIEGLSPGERVITKGSLFIDRGAVGS